MAAHIHGKTAAIGGRVGGYVAVLFLLTQAGLASDHCQSVELAQMLSPLGEMTMNWGRRVAMHDRIALVGSVLDDEGGERAGAAFVYELEGPNWEVMAKLIHEDAQDYDYFGQSVACHSSDEVLIGVTGDDQNGIRVGSVRVFRRTPGFSAGPADDWTEVATLLASDGEDGDWFGRALDVTGDLAIIGANGDDDQGEDCGAAYIFRRVDEAWQEEAKLVPADGVVDLSFGGHVAVSGDVAVVGCPRDFDDGEYGGSTYVFRRTDDAWGQEARLRPPELEEHDSFGHSVAIRGDVLAVGAPGDDDLDDNCGAVYIYQYSGSDWIQEQKIYASDADTPDSRRFGGSAAMTTEYLVAGASGYGDGGSAYVFQYDGSAWVETVRLATTKHVSWGNEGHDVAVHGDFALLGPTACFNGEGAAYVFGSLADCNDNGQPDLCDIGDGVSEDCQPNGVPDECEILIRDCNGNGFPDDCDIAGQFSFDCNGNGIPDECDVFEGTSEDCNENGIPDECDVNDIAAFQTGKLSPIGSSHPKWFYLNSASKAVEDVTMDFTAYADLSAYTEYIDVDINGGHVGSVFENSGSDCPDTPDEDSLVLPASLFNSLVGEGEDAMVTLIASPYVGTFKCDRTTYVTAGLTYVRECSADVNGNGIPDECECLADVDDNDTVNVDDIFAVLDAWSETGGPADVNYDGIVDIDDLFAVLAAWGPCP